MKKLRKVPVGTLVAFSYERADGTERPGVAVMLKARDTRKQPIKNPKGEMKRGRWLLTMFDLARGCERSFWLRRMTDVRPIEIPNVAGTQHEARGYANGWEQGAGMPYRAISVARKLHGMDAGWAVIAMEMQRAG